MFVKILLVINHNDINNPFIRVFDRDSEILDSVIATYVADNFDRISWFHEDYGQFFLEEMKSENYLKASFLVWNRAELQISFTENEVLK